MDNLVDRQARAINFCALGRDFQLITMTVVISNLATLTLISIDSSAQLAISAVVITTLIFALIAGLNPIYTFKAFTFDMDQEEEKIQCWPTREKCTFWNVEICLFTIFYSLSISTAL